MSNKQNTPSNRPASFSPSAHARAMDRQQGQSGQDQSRGAADDRPRTAASRSRDDSERPVVGRSDDGSAQGSPRVGHHPKRTSAGAAETSVNPLPGTPDDSDSAMRRAFPAASAADRASENQQKDRDGDRRSDREPLDDRSIRSSNRS